MDLAKLEDKIRSGRGAINDVNKYAGEAGKMASDEIFRIIKEEYPNGNISESDARKIVSPVLKRGHEKVSELMSIAINRMYEKTGVGLKAIRPEYNIYRENEIVSKIVEWSQEDAEDE